MDFSSIGPYDPASGAFSDYIERLEFYFESVDLDLMSVSQLDPEYETKLERLKSKRRAVFLSNCGQQCFDVIKNLAKPKSVKELSFIEIARVAIEYFDSGINITQSRYAFSCRARGVNESFQNYLADLNKLVKTCCFGVNRDERLRDQIVFGVNDNEIRTKLLDKSILSLEETLKICSELKTDVMSGCFSVILKLLYNSYRFK